MLGPAARWADIDYHRLTSFALRGAGTCAVARAGTAHGLLAWFDTVLVDGVEYSNAPGAVEGIYGQFLFPWPEPVSLQEGDSVAFEVRADPIGGDILWTWNTEIRRGGTPDAGTTRFRQSTLNSRLAPPDSLRKRAGSSADDDRSRVPTTHARKASRGVPARPRSLRGREARITRCD